MALIKFLEESSLHDMYECFYSTEYEVTLQHYEANINYESVNSATGSDIGKH